MAVQINCGDVLWNLAEYTWDDPLGGLYWICLAKRSRGDADSDTDLLEEEDETINNVMTEDYIKVFITLHNQFLNESQARWLKSAGAFPTFEEKQIIEEGIEVGIELTGDDSIMAPYTDIEIQNIKLGFQKIIEHVSNKSRK